MSYINFKPKLIQIQPSSAIFTLTVNQSIVFHRSMTTSPPPKHLRAKPPHKWRVDGKINHEARALDLIDDKAKELDRISKMYNMTEMAPSIASSTVHMISPYATDLAELRLSRLRIEEDHLLEAKRLAEIERLRGPSEKWYVHLYTFL